MKSYLALLMIPLAIIAAYYGSDTVANMLPDEKSTAPVGMVLPSTLSHLNADVITAGPTDGLDYLLNKKSNIRAVAASDDAVTVAKPVREKKYLLRALMIDGAVSVADINGDLVSIGQTVGDYRVVTINDDGVLLRGLRGHKRLTLN